VLPILLIACALGQPAIPGAEPKPAQAPSPAQPETKADPAPLNTAAIRAMSDRLLARGVGAYYSARQLMDWAAEANPTDADTVKQLRAQWEAEGKPGYDALIHEMASRMKLSDDEVIKTFQTQLDKSLADVKAKLDPAKFHAMITERRLEVRSQPPQAASFLYMFDPARAGDDTKLIAAGKVRTVRARVVSGGGTDAVLEFSVPLSWNTVTDEPGSLVVGENGGLGPLTIAVNGVTLPKEGEHDPVKLVGLMTAKSRAPRSEPAAATLAGRPGGQASSVSVSASGKDRVCGLHQFTVTVSGDNAVAFTVGTGASAKPNERDYTPDELAAYARSRKAVIESIMGSIKFADTPVQSKTPASAPTPPPASVPTPASAPAK
jgi:hypothetical protein